MVRVQCKNLFIEINLTSCKIEYMCALHSAPVNTIKKQQIRNLLPAASLNKMHYKRKKKRTTTTRTKSIECANIIQCAGLNISWIYFQLNWQMFWCLKCVCVWLWMCCCSKWITIKWVRILIVLLYFLFLFCFFLDSE